MIKLLIFFTSLAVVSAQMGGWKDQDVNDEQIKTLAERAVKQYNGQCNCMYLFGISEITHAKSQVVAGINYKINLVLGETKCRKSSKFVCDITETSPESRKNFILTVFSQPWAKTEKYTWEQVS